MFLSPRLTHCFSIDIESGRFDRETATLSEEIRVRNDPILVRRNVPSSENEIVVIKASTLNVCRVAPKPASHSLAVPSRDADASSLPFGEKATALTESEWPSSVCI